MFTPAPPRVDPVHAWEPFDGALVVVLNVTHARLTEVRIGDEAYLLAPGVNYMPADLAELGPIEGMIDRGQATLHPPGASVPEVSAAVQAARETAIRDFGGA
jgi:hypothetical protein